jgi:meso-butanediol dehydrogenase / (S,S)-butanediol dehydrogenase / diacetyl reductase
VLSALRSRAETVATGRCRSPGPAAATCPAGGRAGQVPLRFGAVADRPISRRFAGKVAVVAGGTSGIGLATAERIVAEGGHVVIVGRDADRGHTARERVGADRCDFLPADVTDRDQVDRVFAAIERSHGRLDVLVNSAGAVVVAALSGMRSDQWRRCIDVNLTAVFDVCQSALPLLRSTLGAGLADSAAIVNVASLDGVAGDRGMAAYGAAKAGVVNLTRSMALELIGDGIRVNCVSPGAVDTPMTVTTAGVPSNAAVFEKVIPAGRFGRPDEIAAAIAFVASTDASFMVGANLVVDGGVPCSTGHPDLLEMFGMA